MAQGQRSFFSEIISSISHMRFSRDGRYILARDYMALKLWDLNMERQPVAVYNVHDNLRPKASLPACLGAGGQGCVPWNGRVDKVVVARRGASASRASSAERVYGEVAPSIGMTELMCVCSCASCTRTTAYSTSSTAA